STHTSFLLGLNVRHVAREEEEGAKDYQAQAKEWVAAAILDHFRRLFESCRNPQGEYGIDDTLTAARDLLVPDLTRVYDEVAPCFPPQFDVFNMYCSIYHASFNQMMLAWAERADVTADETLALVRWINTFYHRQMLRLGASEEFLKPDLTDALRPL